MLEPRSDRAPHPDTMAWWQTQPEAWAHATTDPQPAETVMPRYADWVEALPGFHVFAAAPIIFDGLWMDHYLETFAGTRVLGGPTKQPADLSRRRRLPLHHGGHAARRRLSEMGHAARAARMVRPHPAHAPRHRRCARLRQCARQTLCDLVGACPRSKRPKVSTNEIHARLAQGTSRHRRIDRCRSPRR